MSLSSTCYICNLSFFDQNRKNEINENNIFLNNFTKYTQVRSKNSLTAVVSGNINALRIYFDEIEQEENKLISHYDTVSRNKLIQSCECIDKYLHADCLIKHCLLNMSFECNDCNCLYSISFMEKSNKKLFFYIIMIIIQLLTIISLIVISILLFTHQISLKTMKIEVLYLDILLACLLQLFNIFLIFFLIFYIKNKNEYIKKYNYIVKDLSINKKKNQQKQLNVKLKENNKLTEMSRINQDPSIFPQNTNDDYIEKSLFYIKNKLNLSLEEILELKISNYQYINHVLYKENQIKNIIFENNSKIKSDLSKKAEKGKINEKEDILLNENERPKGKVFSSLIERKKNQEVYNNIQLKLNIIDSYDSSHLVNDSHQGLRKENSYSKHLDKEVYSKINKEKEKDLEIHMSNKRKTIKKNNLHPIFNLNINQYVINNKNSKEVQKVSLLGGVIKKRKKEKEEKKAKENNEKNSKTFNLSTTKSRRDMRIKQTFKEKDQPKYNLLGNYLKKIRTHKNKNKKISFDFENIQLDYKKHSQMLTPNYIRMETKSPNK